MREDGMISIMDSITEPGGLISWLQITFSWVLLKVNFTVQILYRQLNGKTIPPLPILED